MENQVTVTPTEEVLPEQSEQVIAESAPVAEEQSTETASEQNTDENKAIKSLQRRIDKRTADYYRERAAREALEARLTQTQHTEEPNVQDIDRLVTERAEQLAKQKEIAGKVTKVEQALRANLKDGFDDFFTDLQSSGDSAKALVETVLDLDDSEQVMTHLAHNRDELYQVLNLSPRQQAIQLAKLSVKLEAEKKATKVSSAPKPVTPIGARSANDGLSDNLPIDEWMRRRNEQERKRFA